MGWAHRVPLSVHARHSVDEILTAFGIAGRWAAACLQAEGCVPRRAHQQRPVLRHAREVRARLLAVHAVQGLRDLAGRLFHWESQSRRRRRHRPGSATSTTASAADTSCCSCAQRASRTAGRCRTRSWGRRTTCRTRATGRSRSCGGCAARCRRRCSGRRRWRLSESSSTRPDSGRSAPAATWRSTAAPARFPGYAARAMRGPIINDARSRRVQKRGGEADLRLSGRRPKAVRLNGRNLRR
jgi:hypothetical protein